MLTTAVWASAGLTRPDVARDVILSLHADAAPLAAAALAQGWGANALNEKIEWGKQSLAGRTGAIDTGSYTSGTTVLSLASAAGFYPDCIVRSQATGEQMYCTAVNYSTNDITVIRGVGSVAAQANSVANTVVLENLGPAAGEASLSPTERDYTPAKAFNFLQTFRKSIKVSGRFTRVGGITEDELPRRRMVANKELMIDIDRQLMFGQKNDGATLVSSESKKVTLMGGLREFITTNVDAVAGTATKARLNTFAKLAFSKNGDDKVWFCGPTAVETINTLAENKLQTRQGDVAVGLKITEFLTPYGRALVIYSRQMASPYAGDILSVNLSDIKLRPSNGGQIALKTALEATGEDATKEEWFGEFSVEMGDEENHALATGITGPA